MSQTKAPKLKKLVNIKEIIGAEVAHTKKYIENRREQFLLLLLLPPYV
ncbi:hypothetical protein IMZ68_06900 [Candidatus Bathyarchaeota archaeon]|jgi:hypothetical protein|nr:hypothetical protein [Candidatus Bathyarchaeota archaeon]